MRFVYFSLQFVLLLILVVLRILKPSFEFLPGVPHRYELLVVNYLIFILSVSLIRMVAIIIYRIRKKKRLVKNDNIVVGLNHIANIIIICASLAALLTAMGISILHTFTSLSIVAAAIALITKDYIGNMISGFIITFSQDISIGDYVKIGEFRGKIVDIGMSNIELLNDEEDNIFVPNNFVFANTIINYSRSRVMKIAIDFSVDSKLMSSVPAMEQHLKALMSPQLPHIDEGSVYLKINHIGRKKLDLTFQFVLRKGDRLKERELRIFAKMKILESIQAFSH